MGPSYQLSGLGWAGLGWAGLGWAGLGWAGRAGLGWAGLGWAGLIRNSCACLLDNVCTIIAVWTYCAFKGSHTRDFHSAFLTFIWRHSVIDRDETQDF